MEFKGTKGKWHTMVGGFCKKGDIPNMVQVYAANDDLEMICKVYQDGILTSSVQNYQANALLISKAPEMLEMLIRISQHEYFSGSKELENLIKQATEL